jgi:AraC family transcriptional regulator, melibiose operon regulatory protein
MANPTTPLPAIAKSTERQFYSRTRVFGRFGMRIFKPALMPRPHWHGHVEANFIRHARMVYVMDGQRIMVEPDQLVLFWAGIPHQLVDIQQTSDKEPELCNVYLPLDNFLFMQHIPDLQVAILTGGMVQFSTDLCSNAQLRRWYTDYRTNNPEQLDVAKLEINAMFRRLSLLPFPFLKKPWRENAETSGLASTHVRHVVAMVRYILENLEKPMKNNDVASSTGLHTNYALSLFTRTMQLPLKQFIIRMRLLKARGLLLDSDMAIATIAVDSGFGSASQFYAQFQKAYGTSPQQLRLSYQRMKSA